MYVTTVMKPPISQLSKIDTITQLSCHLVMNAFWSPQNKVVESLACNAKGYLC
jgi:hypothetical protein